MVSATTERSMISGFFRVFKSPSQESPSQESPSTEEEGQVDPTKNSTDKNDDSKSNSQSNPNNESPSQQPEASQDKDPLKVLDETPANTAERAESIDKVSKETLEKKLDTCMKNQAPEQNHTVKDLPPADSKQPATTATSNQAPAPDSKPTVKSPASENASAPPKQPPKKAKVAAGKSTIPAKKPQPRQSRKRPPSSHSQSQHPQTPAGYYQHHTNYYSTRRGAPPTYPELYQAPFHRPEHQPQQHTHTSGSVPYTYATAHPPPAQSANTNNNHRPSHHVGSPRTMMKHTMPRLYSPVVATRTQQHTQPTARSAKSSTTDTNTKTFVQSKKSNDKAVSPKHSTKPPSTPAVPLETAVETNHLPNTVTQTASQATPAAVAQEHVPAFAIPGNSKKKRGRPKKAQQTAQRNLPMANGSSSTFSTSTKETPSETKGRSGDTIDGQTLPTSNHHVQDANTKSQKEHHEKMSPPLANESTASDSIESIARNEGTIASEKVINGKSASPSVATLALESAADVSKSIKNGSRKAKKIKGKTVTKKKQYIKASAPAPKLAGRSKPNNDDQSTKVGKPVSIMKAAKKSKKPATVAFSTRTRRSAKAMEQKLEKEDPKTSINTELLSATSAAPPFGAGISTDPDISSGLGNVARQSTGRKRNSKKRVREESHCDIETPTDDRRMVRIKVPGTISGNNTTNNPTTSTKKNASRAARKGSTKRAKKSVGCWLFLYENNKEPQVCSDLKKYEIADVALLRNRKVSKMPLLAFITTKGDLYMYWNTPRKDEKIEQLGVDNLSGTRGRFYSQVGASSNIVAAVTRKGALDVWVYQGKTRWVQQTVVVSVVEGVTVEMGKIQQVLCNSTMVFVLDDRGRIFYGTCCLTYHRRRFTLKRLEPPKSCLEPRATLLALDNDAKIACVFGKNCPCSLETSEISKIDPKGKYEPKYTYMEYEGTSSITTVAPHEEGWLFTTEDGRAFQWKCIDAVKCSRILEKSKSVSSVLRTSAICNGELSIFNDIHADVLVPVPFGNLRIQKVVEGFNLTAILISKDTILNQGWKPVSLQQFSLFRGQNQELLEDFQEKAATFASHKMEALDQSISMELSKDEGFSGANDYEGANLDEIAPTSLNETQKEDLEKSKKQKLASVTLNTFPPEMIVGDTPSPDDVKNLGKVVAGSYDSHMAAEKNRNLPNFHKESSTSIARAILECDILATVDNKIDEPKVAEVEVPEINGENAASQIGADTLKDDNYNDDCSGTQSTTNSSEIVAIKPEPGTTSSSIYVVVSTRDLADTPIPLGASSNGEPIDLLHLTDDHSHSLLPSAGRRKRRRRKRDGSHRKSSSAIHAANTAPEALLGYKEVYDWLRETAPDIRAEVISIYAASLVNQGFDSVRLLLEMLTPSRLLKLKDGNGMSLNEEHIHYIYLMDRMQRKGLSKFAKK